MNNKRLIYWIVGFIVFYFIYLWYINRNKTNLLKGSPAGSPNDPGGRYSNPLLTTKSDGCYCANNNSNLGGYFGDCPCNEGYYDVTNM